MRLTFTRTFLVWATLLISLGASAQTGTLKGTIRKVRFDLEGRYLSSMVVAGLEDASGLPFDGDYPNATRLGRILDFTVDDVGNLYFVDTLNNRVRKAWIAPLLGN